MRQPSRPRESGWGECCWVLSRERRYWDRYGGMFSRADPAFVQRFSGVSPRVSSGIILTTNKASDGHTTGHTISGSPPEPRLNMPVDRYCPVRGRPRPRPDCGPSRESPSLEPERSSMAAARWNTRRYGFFSPLAPAQDKDTAEPRERLDNTLRSGTTPNSRNVITVQRILGTRGTRMYSSLDR